MSELQLRSRRGEQKVTSLHWFPWIPHRYAAISVLPPDQGGLATFRDAWVEDAWVEDAASGTSTLPPEVSLEFSSRTFSGSSPGSKSACRLFPSSILSNTFNLLFEAMRNIRHNLLALAFANNCLSSSVLAI